MSYDAKDGCPGRANQENSSPQGTELDIPTATVDGNTEVRVDRNVSLLVAAGSAMAAGCEPCLDQLIPSLIEAGVADGDIRKAVEIGQHVKETAAEYMKEVADVLAGTSLADHSTAAGGAGEPTPGSAGCCG